jgi:hypothetical protein
VYQAQSCSEQGTAEHLGLNRLRKNCRSGHPEPASFAGEESAFGKNPRKKQIPHPVQKANGVRNDTL